MHAAAEPDELLMAQVASGRGESLEPLVRRYAVPLVSFLARMTGDGGRAEELFQDTFLAVWRKRRTYQFPRPFKPWLYAVALNACRADFRSAKDTPVTLPDDVPESVGSAGPAEHAIATETGARIARAVANLPPVQRAVVALRVWDGLSYPQIAEAVGRTEATVRSHMSHGLATLRQAIGEC
jgi:RNA polymerase sigma-70 factor (ECF subfamily)